MSKDGVVNDDAVDAGVVVGVEERGFDVNGVVEDAEFVAQAVGATSLARPVGVLFGSGVFVGEESDEEGGLCGVMNVK